jgi:hypothetical protein
MLLRSVSNQFTICIVPLSSRSVDCSFRALVAVTIEAGTTKVEPYAPSNGATIPSTPGRRRRLSQLLQDGLPEERRPTSPMEQLLVVLARTVDSFGCLGNNCTIFPGESSAPPLNATLNGTDNVANVTDGRGLVRLESIQVRDSRTSRSTPTVSVSIQAAAAFQVSVCMCRFSVRFPLNPLLWVRVRVLALTNSGYDRWVP